VYESTSSSFAEPRPCSVALDVFGIEPPYEIELGAVALRGARLGIPSYGVSQPIYDDRLKFRRTLNDSSLGTQQKLIDGFMAALFDLAGEDRNP
jgi:hypothetical protein